MSGAIPLFRALGVRVFLHWSWFIVAFIEVRMSAHRYLNPIWALVEYVSLFALVLLHEFGHALACRSTGGKADRIVLWPLGGLAFVDPPPRAAAVLWSIAAGPLVNAVLFPVLSVICLLLTRAHQSAPHAAFASGDLYRYFFNLFFINTALLVFNLLPFYPLDGGQILRALLWFRFGPIRSLQMSSVVGIFGALALGAAALWQSSFWIGLIALFILSQAAGAFQRAKAMAAEADVPPPRQPEI